MDHRLAHPPSDEERKASVDMLAKMHPGNRFRLLFEMPLLPETNKEPIMNTSEKLTEIFAGATLKWDHRTTLAGTPVLAIHYPSEQAFHSTLSRNPGGPALTEEGEAIRTEARRMRALFLAEWPYGMVGFDIEPNPQPSGESGVEL